MIESIDYILKEVQKQLGISPCIDCDGKGCPKCGEKGYVDWVEKVVGVKKNEFEKFRNSLSSAVGIPKSYLFGDDK